MGGQRGFLEFRILGPGSDLGARPLIASAAKYDFGGRGGKGGGSLPKQTSPRTLTSTSSRPYGIGDPTVWATRTRVNPRQKALHTIRAPGTMKIERAEATCGPGSWTEGLGRPSTGYGRASYA